MPREQWPKETEVTNEVNVKDLDEKGILLEILKEQKKTNLLLSLIYDEEID